LPLLVVKLDVIGQLVTSAGASVDLKTKYFDTVRDNTNSIIRHGAVTTKIYATDVDREWNWSLKLQLTFEVF
jgi:hypothetical protein